MENSSSFAAGRRGLLRRIAGGAAVAAATVALPGCAYKSFTPIPYRPALYEANHADLPGRILLFGSVHAGIPRFYPLPDAIEAAYRSADRVAIELDVASHMPALRAAVAPLAAWAPGESLETVVSPKLLRELRRHFRYDHLEWSKTRYTKPWALALSMVSVDDAGLAATGTHGIESYMLKMAREDGKAVVELETAAEQAWAFAGGSPEEQEAVLAFRLEQLKGYDRTFSQIVQAWRLGDVDRLARLRLHAYPTAGVLGSAHRRVFTERDERMAQRLAGEARLPGTVMAVVGAFHLVGEGNMLDHLREAGFEIKRIGYER